VALLKVFGLGVVDWIHFAIDMDQFDVCVTVHHIWKWREVPTWCNNYDLLS